MLNSEYLGNEKRSFHQEFNWKSSDGLSMYTQCWEPETSPRAVVAFIHGFGEHSSRYHHWAENFVALGLSFCAFDLRGHGKSPGKRGYASDYSKLISDVDSFLDQCKQRYESVPIFLYGHSFGANLAANFVIAKNTQLQGLILTSPWFELIKKPGLFKLTLAKLLKKILPFITIKTGLKAEYISRDLRVVHRYKSDELVHDRISIKLGNQIIEFGEKASRSIYKINTPLLIMHGTGDNITCYKASQQFVQNASNKTKYIEWEDAYHELHNDLDQENVFTEIADWVNENLK